jgi:hypothetical protein
VNIGYHPTIAWHEFGHNMMYRTANPTAYNWAYSASPFSLGIPQFAWGSHNPPDSQHPELAYNEGFANYFFVLLQDYYGITFNPYGWEDYFSGCNNYPTPTQSGCIAYPVGDQNESRVSTFFYRYTQEVLRPANNNINAQTAYGLIRARLWNVGQYNVSFSTAWFNWLQYTLPNGSYTENGQSYTYKALTKIIANQTYFALVGVP